MAASQSPSFSPRLPSPPPMAEDQTLPTSPGVALFEDHAKFPSTLSDTSAGRRIRPGTKAEDMAEGPPLIDLHEIDSAFPLTEHLKALHYHHTNPPNSHTIQPITPEIARQLATPPAGTAREIWLYELARFLIQKTNAIIVALFSDHPPCSPQTCPEMRASEWQYLCAVHDPPKSCAAIDYCCHTLDWAATTLTSSKMFPSRLGLGSGNTGAGGDKVLAQQMKEITNIFRRVYRIYAHAWFQHREMFWRVEGRTGLYGLFKRVCEEYGIIQSENYTIPVEAEGLEPLQEQSRGEGMQAPTLLRREREVEEQSTSIERKIQPVGNIVVAAGDTTKRHRHTPSDRSASVTTVIHEVEEEEEEEEQTESTETEVLSLERQASTLKDFAESLPQLGQEEEPGEEAEVEEVKEEAVDEEDMPAVGIIRSDTLKPAKEEQVEEEEESQDETETTVVEVPAEDEGEGEGEGEGEAKAEVEESDEKKAEEE